MYLSSVSMCGYITFSTEISLISALGLTGEKNVSSAESKRTINQIDMLWTVMDYLTQAGVKLLHVSSCCRMVNERPYCVCSDWHSKDWLFISGIKSFIFKHASVFVVYCPVPMQIITVKHWLNITFLLTSKRNHSTISTLNKTQHPVQSKQHVSVRCLF